jgi:hypothetical protein
MNPGEGNFNRREQSKKRGKMLLSEKENGQKISLLSLFGPVQKQLAPEHIQ